MVRIAGSVILLLSLFLVGFSCEREVSLERIDINVQGFPKLEEDQLPTKVGAALGRLLFYDPIFSKDGSMSCGSCHQQSASFAHKNQQFSEGVEGFHGDRNASAIINPAWGSRFFWDGRAFSLREQAGQPVENPIELNQDWEVVLQKIAENTIYVDQFAERFPEEKVITRFMVETVIAEFEESMVTANSKYDQFVRDELVLTSEEIQGMNLFFGEEAECFHCHGMPLFTDHRFHNNGLDTVFTDPGLASVTASPIDSGKFLTPSLRNIELTGPYMHDGRFSSLEEVVDFYSEGVHFSNTIDPLIVGRSSGGADFTNEEKKALVAFMKTLTDIEFISNPSFSDPN